MCSCPDMLATVEVPSAVLQIPQIAMTMVLTAIDFDKGFGFDYCGASFMLLLNAGTKILKS